MIRPLLACAVLVVVLVAGAALGAIRVVTDTTPDL